MSWKEGVVAWGGLGYAYNIDAGLRKWRAACARIGSGATEIANVVLLGDSITEGFDATTKDSQSWASRLKAAIITKYGDVGYGYKPYWHYSLSSEWTFTGVWAEAPNFGVFNYYYYTSETNATATIDFNGTGVRILSASASTGSTFTATIDGGSPTSFTCAGTVSYWKNFDVSGLDAGDHTLVLTYTGDASHKLLLHGIIPLKGTSGIRVHNIAKAGTGIAGAVYANALPVEIDAFAPILTIISLISNDYAGQTSLETYRSNVQTLVTRALTTGDVLLTSAVPRNQTYTIPQSSYASVLNSLAKLNNIAYIDFNARWLSGSSASTLGLIGTNPAHPTDAGHFDISMAICDVLDM